MESRRSRNGSGGAFWRRTFAALGRLLLNTARIAVWLAMCVAYPAVAACGRANAWIDERKAALARWERSDAETE